MKTFSQVELHYRFQARDFPTNVHFCQLHNTIVAYAPHLEGVIKAVERHIELKKQEIEKYRESDRIYASECQKALAYDYEFIRQCEIATQYVTLEKRLDTGVRLTLIEEQRLSIEAINSHRFVSKRERLQNALAWQIERGWNVPDPKGIPGWYLDERSLILSQDIDFFGSRIIRMGTAFGYPHSLTGDPVQDLLDHGHVDFELL